MSNVRTSTKNTEDGALERRVRFIDATDRTLLGFEICAPDDPRFARNLAITLERFSLECLLTKRLRRGRMRVYRFYVAPRDGSRLDEERSLDVRTALLVLVATGELSPQSERSGIRPAMRREPAAEYETVPRRTA